MPAPKTLAGQAVLKELTDLNKSLRFRLGDFKALVDLRKNYAEIARQRSQIVAANQGLRQVRQATKETADLYRDLNKRAKELGKVADESKNLWDRFLSKIPGGNKAEKAAAAGGSLGALLLIGGIAAIQIAIQLLQRQINDANIDNINGLVTELGKTATLAINNKIEIKGLQEREQNTKTKINDITYEVREGRRKVEEKIDAAKRQSNDALYETREGRRKLETQINEQNSNFKSLKADFDKAFKNIGSGFQEKIAKTITEIQSSLKSTDNQIKSANEKISVQAKIIADLQTGFKTVQGLPKTIDTKIAELKEFTIKLVNGKLQPVEVEQKKITQQISTIQKNGVTRTDIEATNASLRKTYEQSFEYKAQQWQQEIQKQNENFWNKKTDVTLSTTTKTTQSNTEKIAQLERDNTKIKTDLDKIDKQIKEQTKVNQEAIPKLNSILNLIPLIPARVADNIRPSIPTLPQIENATGTAVCKSLNGGCAGRALNDAVNNVKGNANNNTGNILDAINTGANAALLQGQGEILNRLGPQLPGGLSSTFGRLWQTLQIDRIINLLTLITTFHNALMLSNNIAQTLFGAVDNISQATGFKWKNEKGEEVGFGSIVSDWTEDFFKTIFGTENYTNLVNTYKRANRIYQAGANIINSVRSIIDSTRNVTEYIAENTGKIGNALKRFGVVGGNAFNWMPEQVDARSVWVRRLENVGQVADGFEMVTGEVLSTTQNLNEIREQTEEFDRGIKGLPPKEREDNDPVKAREDNVAVASLSALIPPELERNPQ